MVDCAIIGCGRIAGGYDVPGDGRVRTHAKAYVRNPECRLVGVCDADAAAAKAFAETWGAPVAVAHPLTLLDRCQPELLSICTPTDTHAELVAMACAAGVPRVWLEKPAAGSIAAVERMQEQASLAGTEIWVNYFRRYDAGFIRAREAVAEISPLRSVRAIYTKGLRHNGSHMIDLIHWFFGQITGIAIDRVLPDPDYPAVSARLQTPSAPVDLVALDYRDFELFELDILGARGRLTVKDGGQQIVTERVVESRYYQGYRNLAPSDVHADSYAAFMQAGLERGLRGAPMPGLAEELAIQKVLERFSRLAGVDF